MRTRSHIIGKSGACKYSALWRGAESSLAKFPHREGRGTVTQRQGRERRGGRPYAPARALYCYFTRSFNNVACGIALIHSLTHSLSRPLPSRKFLADPIDREILQSGVERKAAVIAEKLRATVGRKLLPDVRLKLQPPSIFHAYYSTDGHKYYGYD